MLRRAQSGGRIAVRAQGGRILESVRLERGHSSAARERSAERNRPDRGQESRFSAADQAAGPRIGRAMCTRSSRGAGELSCQAGESLAGPSTGPCIATAHRRPAQPYGAPSAGSPPATVKGALAPSGRTTVLPGQEGESSVGSSPGTGQSPCSIAVHGAEPAINRSVEQLK